MGPEARADSFGSEGDAMTEETNPPQPAVRSERRGAVLLVRIDRPEVRNAISPAVSTECAAQFDVFAADPSLRVAILTGTGGQAFCAGSDLRPQSTKVPRPATGFGGLTERFDLDKPIIAAVNGVALGGGFELALACDIIIAAAGASFGLPEPRIGLAPLAGGPHRLARAIGDKRALALLLSARTVDAREAQVLGFVHEVVPDDKLMDTAWRLAEDIAALSPAAVRACKQLVARGLAEPSVEAAMRAQADYPAVKAMFASGDAREGVRAFREKRAPEWRS